MLFWFPVFVLGQWGMAAPPPDAPLGPAVGLPMQSETAAEVTSRAVHDPTFWDPASVVTYAGEDYDQLRLRPMEEGYFTMITGEGRMDFSHDVAVNTAFRYQDELPAIEDRALSIRVLGEGRDEASGLPYVDTLFFLDFTLFYGIYIQRSYRLSIDGFTFVFFEMLRSDWVDAQTWDRYQQIKEDVVAQTPLRWVFNEVVPLAEVYGTFVVAPGAQHTTRISFLVRLQFGEEAGAIARFATEMPIVLRLGLQSGFENCVAIARTHQSSGE